MRKSLLGCTVVYLSLSLLPLMSSGAFGAEGKAEPERASSLDVGGFIDAGAYWSSEQQNTGFGLNEAAFSLSKKLGLGEARVDLPVSGNLNNQHFDFDTERAQVFVSYKYGNGLRWKFGQFESLFGYEPNLSVDRRFSRSGIVSDQLLVSTHTGATVGYDMGENLSFTLLAANPNGDSALHGRKLEYGALVGWNFSKIRASLGYSMNQDDRFNDNKTNSLVSAIVGTTVGALSADVEFDMKKSAGFPDSAKGVAGHFGYAVTEDLEAGLRAEYLNKAADRSGLFLVDMQNAITIGPSYELTKGLKVRADYTLNNVKVTSNAETNRTHEFGLSVVSRF